MISKPPISKPEDLANHVIKKLQSKLPDLNQKVLIKLLDVLFYTSLHSEEGQMLHVTVTLLNPSNKTDNTSPNKDQWQLIPFENHLEFDVNILKKLAKAADPWSTSLAVFYDNKDELYIHGMIDQAIHLKRFVHFETDNKPEQAGLLSVAITGVGTLAVTYIYELIATLKQESLIKLFHNVLRSGPIKEIVYEIAKKFSSKIIDHFEVTGDESDLSDLYHYVHETIRKTLSRLINQVKNYNHGGTILITENFENLEIKYKMLYPRLSDAVCDLVISFTEEGINQPDEETDSITGKEYYHLKTLNKKKLEAENQLKGAIRFVASQSQVDGLILMDKNLIVKGFGVVITKYKPPKYIYLADAADPGPSSLNKRESNHFGTRHQSMFAFCAKNPGSIGFIVSQDGDIRAVTNLRTKVVMWDNVKIQKTFRTVKKVVFSKSTNPSQ